MNYYLMLDIADLRKWIVEELCAKTGLDRPPSIFGYSALPTSADGALFHMSLMFQRGEFV